MKTRPIEVIKLLIEVRTLIQINFCWSRKDGDHDTIEIDFEFAKNSLRSANVQKKFSKSYFLRCY